MYIFNKSGLTSSTLRYFKPHLKVTADSVKFGGCFFDMKNYNENEIKPQGFFVNLNWDEAIQELDDVEAGQMFKNMFHYLLERNLIETSRIVNMISKMTVFPTLEYNVEKYQKMVERNRKNGKSGGRKKDLGKTPEEPIETQKNPVGFSGNLEEAKDKAIDKAIDKVRDIVKEIDTEIDNDTEKEIATGRIKETDPRFRIFYLKKFKNLLDVLPDSLTNQDDCTYVQRANHLHRKLGPEIFSKLIFEPQSEEAQEIINDPEFKLNLSDLDFVRYHMVGYLRRLVK